MERRERYDVVSRYKDEEKIQYQQRFVCSKHFNLRKVIEISALGFCIIFNHKGKLLIKKNCTNVNKIHLNYYNLILSIADIFSNTTNLNMVQIP